MQTCPRLFALSRKRVCALCAAPDVHGRLCRHVHAPLLCQGSVCVLFAQPQMCMAAYADMSTPLCFVKEACVCSLRSPRCAWPLNADMPTPLCFVKEACVCSLRSPRCAWPLNADMPTPLCFAKEACVCSLRSPRCAWPLMQTCPRPGSVCVLFAQPQMCMAAYADMSTPLCFVKEACVCSLRSR
jgi:hypothetical protein